MSCEKGGNEAAWPSYTDSELSELTARSEESIECAREKKKFNEDEVAELTESCGVHLSDNIFHNYSEGDAEANPSLDATQEGKVAMCEPSKKTNNLSVRRGVPMHRHYPPLPPRLPLHPSMLLFPSRVVPFSLGGPRRLPPPPPPPPFLSLPFFSPPYQYPPLSFYYSPPSFAGPRNGRRLQRLPLPMMSSTAANSIAPPSYIQRPPQHLRRVRSPERVRPSRVVNSSVQTAPLASPPAPKTTLLTQAVTSSPRDDSVLPYPLIYVSPAGTISVMLQNEVVIEMAVDRSIRVVLHDGFAAIMNARGTAAGILHPCGRVVQSNENVFARFMSTNEKMALFGSEGILFTMSHLSEAYLVNSASFHGASSVGLDQQDFPSLLHDFTLRLFYTEAQTGKQFVDLCKEIVAEATYTRSPDESFVVHLNGVSIRQTASGDVSVDARPRHISCQPAEKVVTVRSSSIDMAIQASEKGYVKQGGKRVHVSHSGMVVSDGNCITSMDHFGRIVSCS